MNRALFEILDQRANKLIKLSPSGEIFWEKALMSKDNLPSHFEGLNITWQWGHELEKAGFKNARSLAFFEFSLQKWQSESGYNNRNTALDMDLEALCKWLDSLEYLLGYEFNSSEFEFYRIDLSQNFIVEGVRVEEFLRSLEIKLSRHPNGEKIHRYPGCVYYGSSWLAKKLYWKYQEFMDIERKKKATYTTDYLNGEKDMKLTLTDGRKRALYPSEIQEMLNMVRFECEFKRHLLKKAGVNSIADIPKLFERFEEEKKKYLTVQRISGEVVLTPVERCIIEDCKRLGINVAKVKFFQDHKERVWYKHKKNLQAKGIFIECIDNADWRLDTEAADRTLNYTLRLAA